MELDAPVPLTEDAPIVRLVNAILSQAIEDRASDVHIEPGAERLRVRFRIDGVLHDTSEAPLSVHRSVMSRLKIMAGIDITQTRLPQDGRFSVNHQGQPVDIRMATLPTASGEAAIMRLLDQRSALMELSALGFEPEQLARYESVFRLPQGAIIVERSDRVGEDLHALRDGRRDQRPRGRHHLGRGSRRVPDSTA